VGRVGYPSGAENAPTAGLGLRNAHGFISGLRIRLRTAGYRFVTLDTLLS
jgi:hypothetical protein